MVASKLILGLTSGSREANTTEEKVLFAVLIKAKGVKKE